MIFLLVQDVRSDNYLGGKLVDVSVSWTKLHLLLSTDVQSEEAIDKAFVSDLYEFDEMIRCEGISTKIKAAPPAQKHRIKSMSRAKTGSS